MHGERVICGATKPVMDTTIIHYCPIPLDQHAGRSHQCGCGHTWEHKHDDAEDVTVAEDGGW